MHTDTQASKLPLKIEHLFFKQASNESHCLFFIIRPTVIPAIPLSKERSHRLH